jgi:hypothetical protein
VIDTRELRRTELAIVLLGVTLALPGVILAVDAIRFHTSPLTDAVVALALGDVRPRGVAMLALLPAGGSGVTLAVRSVLRQAIRHRRRMRSRLVDGCCSHGSRPRT